MADSSILIPQAGVHPLRPGSFAPPPRGSVAERGVRGERSCLAVPQSRRPDRPVSGTVLRVSVVPFLTRIPERSHGDPRTECHMSGAWMRTNHEPRGTEVFSSPADVPDDSL